MHDEIGPPGHDADTRRLPMKIEQFAPGVALHGVTIERRAEQRREDDRTEPDDDGKADLCGRISLLGDGGGRRQRGRLRARGA